MNTIFSYLRNHSSAILFAVVSLLVLICCVAYGVVLYQQAKVPTPERAFSISIMVTVLFAFIEGFLYGGYMVAKD